MKARQRKWLALGFALLGCREEGLAAQPPPAPTLAVPVTEVVERRLEREVSLPGELSAYQEVALFPKVPSFVATIPVDRGSKVRRGDLIARLLAPELAKDRAAAEARVRGARASRQEAEAALPRLRAQRLEAQATFAAEEATFRRLKEASATPGVIAGNELETAGKRAEAAAARVDAARAAERSAALNVRARDETVRAAHEVALAHRDTERYLVLRAPFDGVVTERNAHPGTFVGPFAGTSASPVVRLQQISRLRLTVHVPERHVGAIVPNAKVAFRVPAYPGATFRGTVARLAHALDRRSRTMAVELDVENQDGRLAANMYAEVTWPVRRPGFSLFVPSTAVAQTTEAVFVVRVREGRVERSRVTLGARMGDLVEVFGSLAKGDLVAIRGSDEHAPGTPVVPQRGP